MGLRQGQFKVPNGEDTVKRRASLVAQMVKRPPAMRVDPGSIPESGRPPGEGNGSPLQYSCLENPMDTGAHGVAKSRT